MNWNKEIPKILGGITFFLFLYFFPQPPRIFMGLKEALALAHWYAQKPVIFCLLPAFFIAGAISVFISKDSVIQYLGPKAPLKISYGVASIAGTILAVCSCTVLPLFASIYLRGAGLGPATTFLYSGPAINILAIILTARILGLKLGIARAIFAITASILIGLLMEVLFRPKENPDSPNILESSQSPSPITEKIFFMGTLIGILICATWGPGAGLWGKIYAHKWFLLLFLSLLLFGEVYYFWQVSAFWLLVTIILIIGSEKLFSSHELSFSLGILGFSWALFRNSGEAKAWLESSYMLARKILPLLFLGVMLAGFFLGRPGHEGFISSIYVSKLVGGEEILSNLFAAIIGAFMYFATLTEIPILQGLIGAGMGKGPALALLLAGPAVSLPSILVIRSVLGTKKTIAYLSLVILFSTLCGFIFGHLLSN